MLARKELSYIFHFCLEKRSEVPAKKQRATLQFLNQEI